MCSPVLAALATVRSDLAVGLRIKASEFRFGVMGIREHGSV